MDYKENVVEIKQGDVKNLEITVTPFGATSPAIEYTSSNQSVFTVLADSNNRIAKVTAVGEGTAILTATAGNVKATVTINVKAA